jgi:50S ribosomal subunit-associated GTPase HflX
MEAVDAILRSLHLDSVSKLVVFNKIDRLSDGAQTLTSLCRRHRAVAVSALSRQGLDHLVEAADRMLGERRPNGEAIHGFVAD